MHVGVIMAVQMHDAVDNRLRLLARGRVIQINQRLVADKFCQYREIGTDFFYGKVCHIYIARDGVYAASQSGTGAAKVLLPITLILKLQGIIFQSFLPDSD